jgi:hypothetical protein
VGPGVFLPGIHEDSSDTEFDNLRFICALEVGEQLAPPPVFPVIVAVDSEDVGFIRRRLASDWYNQPPAFRLDRSTRSEEDTLPGLDVSDDGGDVLGL